MLNMAQFRAAAEADVDIILKMMSDFYAEEGYPFNSAVAKNCVLALIRDERLGRMWVAQPEDRVVGYLAVTLGFSLEFRGRTAFVDELFIEQTHRRNGLGREAMQVAEQYCRGAGVQALHLEVERHRDIARGMYVRFGFRDNERYLMTKRLVEPA